MTYVIIDHEVESYDEWKQAFDAHDATRVEYGQQGYQLFRDETDQGRIVILFEFDSIDRARELMHSDDLRERMSDAGVKGKPTIRFLDQVEQQDLAQPSA